MGSGAPLTRIESFPAVMRAVIDSSRESRKTFYNFTESFGLGILI
jgi:hypothetical protein